MATVHAQLNLASEPFGRTRLFWTLAVLTGFLLVSIAVFLVLVFVWKHQLPEALLRDEARLRSELAAIQQQQAELKARLDEPGNDQVLARSLFLNELLLRKGISWTRTFGDLEAILPPRVRMIMIRPEVSTDNKVVLDMQVAAEAPEDFIDFLKELESSEAFGSPNLRSSNPPSENEPAHRYQLMVSYDQRF